MAKSVTSPDISVLDFKVLLDMSIATPSLKVINNSTVTNAANLQWAFVIYSPNGTPIHIGNFTTPDINGVAFTTYTVTEQLPKIWGLLEFSNLNEYSIKVMVKDGDGNIFDLTKAKSICKPNGNNGKNNFGAANINIQTKCGSGQLYVTDQTNLIYKSIVGSKVSTQVTLTYPRDANGNELADVTVSMLPALLPIKYEGDRHEVYVANVFEYDLGDFFLVRVRYSFTKTFGVWCNINVGPLLCEVAKLTQDLKGDCGDNLEKREKYQKLTLANTYLLEVVTAIMQPLSFANFDIVSKVEDIKNIIGIECDCCRPAGVSSVGSVLLTDANLSTNKVCGDLTLGFENDGNGNIVLNYQGVSYTFNVSGSTSMEFEFTPTVNCVKTVTLSVNMPQFSLDILNQIKNTTEFANVINNAVNGAVKVCSGLDGKNVINITACNYVTQVGSQGNDARINGIIINGDTYSAPANLYVHQDGNIQTWLNSLSKGVFVVTYSGITDKTTITSDNNSNVISSVYVINDDIEEIVVFSNNCSFICTIIQKIINFLDELNFVNIKTGGVLSLCSLNSSGELETTEYAADTSALTFITAMANKWCSTLSYMHKKLLSCDNLKTMFAAFTNATANPTTGDIVLMIVNGKCQQIPLKNLALSLFGLLGTDTDVKNIYCLNAKCTSVSDCVPVSGLAASIGDTSASVSWNAGVGAIGYKWSIDGTNYQQVTGTTVNVTGLTAATAYTFRIYPVYNSGDGTSCQQTLEFTTTNAGVACAAPAGLTLGAATATSFTAEWEAVTGATAYQYRLNGGGWINVGILLFVTPTGLDSGTTYNFEVRAIIGGNPCAEIASDSIDTVEDDFFSLSYSNNTTDADPISLKIGNNNTTPTTDIYNGSYSSDPIDGNDAVNLPAVNANILLTVTGKIITSCSCNGIPGPTGAASATWGGVNGPVQVTFTTN